MTTIRALAQVSVWQQFDDDRDPKRVVDANRFLYFTGLEYRDLWPPDSTFIGQ